MKDLEDALKSHCQLHWWNGGKKTLSYNGDLKGLLEAHNISFTKRKSEHEGLYIFYFKSIHGISYTIRGTINDFAHLAKQAVQMELVRMGDKSQLYVDCFWRPTVNVNF